MRREPWTLEELLRVMAHPELTDEELVARLGDRGDIGTGVIRIGLHTYHENDSGPAQREFLPEICRASTSPDRTAPK